MREIRGVFPVLLAVLLLTGCRKKSDATADGGAGAAADHAADEERGKVGAKLNVYVSCLNSINPVVYDSRTRYLAWADPVKGPSGKGSVSGVPEVGRETTYGYDCFKRNGGLDGIEKMGPKNEKLDKAGLAYKQALIEAMAATKTSSTYYEHGDYKDDKFKKGKELHKPLMDAFSKFDAATADLRGVMQDIQDKMSTDEMAELEKTVGKKAAWHQVNMMMKAKQLIRAVNAGDKPDPAKFGPPGEAYAKAFTEMKTWSDTNPEDAKKNVHWGNFVRYSDELATEMKEMNRFVRDKKKIPESGSGSPQQFIAKYNQLVDISNTMSDH